MAFNAVGEAPELATGAIATTGVFNLWHVTLRVWGREAIGWTDEKGSLETSTTPDVPSLSC